MIFANALVGLVRGEFIGIDAAQIVANLHAKLLFVRVQLEVQRVGNPLGGFVVLLDNVQIFVMSFEQQREMGQQEQMMLDQRCVVFSDNFTRAEIGKALQNV